MFQWFTRYVILDRPTRFQIVTLQEYSKKVFFLSITAAKLSDKQETLDIPYTVQDDDAIHISHKSRVF